MNLKALFAILFLSMNVIFSQTTNLSVNFNNIIQNNFLGVNGVYHGFSFMHEQEVKGMSATDRAREFNRVFNMRLNIARTWYGIGWALSDSLNLHSSFDWNTYRMQKFYLWLTEMKNMNVDVAINLGWWLSFTYWRQDSIKFNVASNCIRFAKWVSESIYQLITVRGFTNIKYGFLFTEPNNETGLPSGWTWQSYYKYAVLKIDSTLRADNRRNNIKLIGPNISPNNIPGNFFTTFRSFVNDPDLSRVFDIYSAHDYNYANNKLGYQPWSEFCDSLKNSVASTGKPIWLDEWGYSQDYYFRTTDYYADFLAQAIIASMNAGVQTSLLWTLFDQQYVYPQETLHNPIDGFYYGIQRTGTCKWPHDIVDYPTLPYSVWYAFSLFSKYFPGGSNTKVYATANSNNVFIAAIETPSGEYSFLVVNGNESISQNITVGFINRSINTPLNRYIYIPGTISVTENATLISSDKQYANVTNSFSDLLTPKSVAVYSSLWNIKKTMYNSKIVQLTAIADGGTHTYTYTWYRNNVNLNLSSQTISQSLLDYNSGVYRCELRDVFNNLTVLYDYSQLNKQNNSENNYDLKLNNKFQLRQNYPNPYNPTTSIKYQLPKDGFVSLKVYDMLGREVANLVNENKKAGYYEVNFDAHKLASGVYVYTLRVNDFVQSKKMILMK